MELAAVIGCRAQGLTVDNAMGAVAGYVAFVDIGARDIGELARVSGIRPGDVLQGEIEGLGVTDNTAIAVD